MLTLASAKHELATFCQRRALDPVRFAVAVREGARVVEASIDLGAQTVAGVAPLDDDTPPQKAEAFAALALARTLAELEDAPEPNEWIGDDLAEQLRRDNPKSRLCNALMIRGLQAPVFEIEAIMTPTGNAFEGGAFLDLPDGTAVHAPLRCARDRVLVEQASARVLLADPAVGALLARVPDEPPLQHALTLAHELVRAGLFEAFGLTFLREPTTTRPLFQVGGWWRDKDGVRHEIEPVEARAKKAADFLAARAILAAVRASLGRVSPMAS
jgi:PAS domain-containing protein